MPNDKIQAAKTEREKMYKYLEGKGKTIGSDKDYATSKNQQWLYNKLVSDGLYRKDIPFEQFQEDYFFDINNDPITQQQITQPVKKKEPIGKDSETISEDVSIEQPKESPTTSPFDKEYNTFIEAVNNREVELNQEKEKEALLLKERFEAGEFEGDEFEGDEERYYRLVDDRHKHYQQQLTQIKQIQKTNSVLESGLQAPDGSPYTEAQQALISALNKDIISNLSTDKNALFNQVRQDLFDRYNADYLKQEDPKLTEKDAAYQMYKNKIGEVEKQMAKNAQKAKEEGVEEIPATNIGPLGTATMQNEVITKTLDDLGLKGGERSEFRTYLLQRSNSEQAIKKTDEKAKEIMANIGMQTPEQKVKAFQYEVSKINDEYSSKMATTLETTKQELSKIDTDYNEKVDVYKESKTKLADQIKEEFQLRIGTRQKEIESELTQFATGLQQKVNSGQMKEDEAKELLAQRQEASKAEILSIQNEANDALKELQDNAQKELHDMYMTYQKARSQYVQGDKIPQIKSLDALKAKMISEIGAAEKKYGVDLTEDQKLKITDKNYLEKYAGVYTQAMAENELDDKLKKEVEWNNLGLLEKLGVSLEKGFFNLGETVGLTAKWLSPQSDFADFSVDLLGQFRKSLPAKDFGEFAFSNLSFDQVIATIGEQTPVMLPLIALGGGATKVAQWGLSGLGMSTKVLNGVSALIGAGVSRPLEATMEAASVHHSLLSLGKSYDDAYAASKRVFHKNMGLILMDAVQNYMWFRKQPKIIRAADQGMQPGFFSGMLSKGKDLAMSFGSEYAEEVYQGYAQDVEINPAMGLIEYIGSSQGKEAGFGGGLFGLMFGFRGMMKNRGDYAFITNQLTDFLDAKTKSMSFADKFKTMPDRFRVRRAINQVSKFGINDKLAAKMQEMGVPDAIVNDLKAKDPNYQLNAIKERYEDIERGNTSVNESDVVQRDLQLRRTLEDLKSRDVLSEEEYTNAIAKLDAAVENAKKSVNGDLPFHWRDDKFKQYGAWTHEANEIRKEAEALPRHQKSEKEQLIKRAEAIEKQIKKVFEDPDAHYYAINGVPITKEEFESFVTDPNNKTALQDIYLETTDTDLESKLLNEIGDIPTFNTYHAIQRAKELLVENTGVQESLEVEDKAELDNVLLEDAIETQKTVVEELKGNLKQSNPQAYRNALNAYRKANRDLYYLEYYKATRKEGELAKDIQSKFEKGIDKAETYLKEQTQKEQPSMEDLEATMDSVDQEIETIKDQLFDKRNKIVQLEKQGEAIPDELQTEVSELEQLQNEKQLLYNQLDAFGEEIAKQEDTQQTQEATDEQEQQPTEEEATETKETQEEKQEPTPIKETSKISKTKQAERDQGFRVVDGVKYERQSPIKKKKVGKKRTTLFSRDPRSNKKVGLETEFTIIEVDDLQPSHKDGKKNPLFFIDEAQPRDRSEDELKFAAAVKGGSLNPEELGSSPNAYYGAAVVNERGESIQGNGRSEGLIWYYKNANDGSYQQFLKDNAEEFGFKAEDFDGFNNPVVVRMAKVDDATAIQYGNYKSSDLEDVERKGEKTKARLKTLRPDQKAELAELVMDKSDPNDTLNEAVRKGGKELLSKMVSMGLIKPGERNQMLSKKGNKETINTEGVAEMEKIVKQLFFDQADADIQKDFDFINANARKGIERSTMQLLSMPEDTSLIDDVHNAIMLLADFETFKAAYPDSSFKDWLNQKDITGKAPIEEFPANSLAIAHFLAEKGKTDKKGQLKPPTEKEIQTAIKNYAEDTKSIEGDMFSPGKEGMSKEQAIEKNFNAKLSDYAPTEQMQRDKKTSAKSDQKSKQKKQAPKTGGKQARTQNIESNKWDSTVGTSQHQTEDSKAKEVRPAPFSKEQKEEYIKKKGVPRMETILPKLRRALPVIWKGLRVIPRVYYAKSRVKGLLGDFNKANSKIRSFNQNDVPTILHEMGHFVDLHLDLTPTDNSLDDELSKFWDYGSKPNQSEARAIAKQQLKKEGYKNPTENAIQKRTQELMQQYRRGEGYAEFFRALMINPEQAKAMAPKLYEETKKTILSEKNGDKRWAAIEEVSDEIRMAYTLHPYEQAQSMTPMTRSQETYGGYKKWGDGIKALAKKFGLIHDDMSVRLHLFDEFQYQVSNRLHPAKKILKELQRLAGVSGKQLLAEGKVDDEVYTIARLLMGFASKTDALFRPASMGGGMVKIIKDKDGNIGYEQVKVKKQKNGEYKIVDSKDKDGQSVTLDWLVEAVVGLDAMSMHVEGKGKFGKEYAKLEAATEEAATYMTAKRTLEYVVKLSTDKISQGNREQQIEAVDELMAFLDELGVMDNEIKTEMKDVIGEKATAAERKDAVDRTLRKIQQKDPRGAFRKIAEKYARLENLTALSFDQYEKPDLIAALDILRMHEQAPKEYQQKIEDFAKRYQILADLGMQYLRDTGTISKEEYADIKRYNQEYVALHRIHEQEMGDATSQEAKMRQNSPLELMNPAGTMTGNQGGLQRNKIKGGSALRKNANEALIESLMHTVKFADINYVQNKFLEYITKIESEGKGATSMIANKLSEDEYMDIIKKNPNAAILRVLNNGKNEYWQMDNGLYKSIKEFGRGLHHDTNNAAAKAIVKTMEKVTQFRRRMITSYPVFALVTNPLRDLQTRYITSRTRGLPFSNLKAKYPLLSKFASSIGMNPADFELTNKEAKTLMDLYGAGQAGFDVYFKSPRKYYKALFYGIKENVSQGNYVPTLGDAAQKWNQWMSIGESANRLAEFKSAYKKFKRDGLSDVAAAKRAALETRDLMDFAIAGQAMAWMRSFALFINPSIQGAKKGLKFMAEAIPNFDELSYKTWGEVMQRPSEVVSRTLMFGLLPALMEYIGNVIFGDDDALEKLNDLAPWQRDLFFNIQIAGYDGFISIPKGYETSLYSAFFSRMIAKAEGKKDPFGGYGDTVLRGYMPFEVAGLTQYLGVIGDVINMTSNWHPFKKKHIVTPDEEGKRTELRYGNKYASNVGILFERMLNKMGATRADARYVDYAIDSWFGYWGRFTNQVILNQLPLVDREKPAKSMRFDPTDPMDYLAFFKLYRYASPQGYKTVQNVFSKTKEYDLKYNEDYLALKTMIKGFYDSPIKERTKHINQITAYARDLQKKWESKEKQYEKYLSGGNVKVGKKTINQKNTKDPNEAKELIFD